MIARFQTSSRVLALRADSTRAGLFEFAAPSAASAHFEVRKGFAVVRISGPLARVSDGIFDSYPAIRSRVAAALASPSKKLLLRIDSPGGDVQGCVELTAYIRSAAKAAGKDLTSFLSGTACAGAYVIACAATRIYAERSATIGGVGCVSMIFDQTAMDRAMGLSFAVVANGARKLNGNPHVPISEHAVAAARKEVADFDALLFAQVARGRGIPAATVARLAGASYIGIAALNAGLIDGVASLDAVLAGAPLAGATPVRAQATIKKTAPAAKASAATQKKKTEEKKPMAKATTADSGVRRELAALKARVDRAFAEKETRDEKRFLVTIRENGRALEIASGSGGKFKDGDRVRVSYEVVTEKTERGMVTGEKGAVGGTWRVVEKAYLGTESYLVELDGPIQFEDGTNQTVEIVADNSSQSRDAAARAAHFDRKLGTIPSLSSQGGRLEGSRFVLPTMTPAEARAAYASRKAGL